MSKRFVSMLLLVSAVSVVAYAEEPPATEPVAAVEATPAPKAEEAKAASKVSVGKEGFFKPGLLLQGWFDLNRSGGNTTNQFKIRRAEIHAKGEILPGTIGYGVMIDPSKILEFGNSTIDVANQDPAATNPAAPEQVTVKQPVSNVSMFQDFYITLLSEFADVSLGQFKIPVSWEGFNSSSKLLFPERALSSKTFGDKRDLGLKAAKTFGKFGYVTGLYNGQGQNTADTNNQKDFTVRLEAYPIEGLTVAAVTYDSIGQRSKSGTKDRFEGDVRYENGPFLLQSEYIYARDVGSTGAATKAQGFYAALAWMLMDSVQPCFRLGYLDPDTSKNLNPTTAGGSDEVWHYDFGVNYYLKKQEMKLQAAFSRFQYQDKSANSELIVAAQVAF